MKTLRNPISRRISIYAFTAVALFFFMTGCGSVYKNPLIDITIQPTEPGNIRANSLGIFNFNYLDEGDNSQLSFAFAEILQAELLKHHFIRVAATTKRSFRDVDQAIEIGRQLGYDLILVGTIDKYYEGMRSSDSEVSITLKIIETQSSTTLWYLTGQMAAKYHPGSDYILFHTDAKPATSPSVLGQSVLKRMAKELCSFR